MKRFSCYLLLLIAFTTFAAPKITVKHQRSADNYARVQVSNETNAKLLCHVAIDGHKIKFKLQPFQTSQWFKATDSRFNHEHFSVWCDYLDLHPEHQDN
ncbi:hypothetical protein [Litorilituus sediminis]|uniref:Uncharacterized protein n=1 Tax=Litorilituus sediminis TaxID=718192 RepID=A0A4P6P9M0_9GAMM|nr:hypothetical protein [Litorilituus sediminis]QBG36245.1 hypothetical protein EMK97_11230 [Litorilituus sediminis]